MTATEDSDQTIFLQVRVISLPAVSSNSTKDISEHSILECPVPAAQFPIIMSLYLPGITSTKT